VVGFLYIIIWNSEQLRFCYYKLDGFRLYLNFRFELLLYIIEFYL
jgi:hypothetical protein